MSNDHNIVHILIQNGADLNAKDNHSQTPLHYAARLNKIEMAEILLQAGADVDPLAIYPTNPPTVEPFSTPLHMAATFASPEMVSLLLTHNASVEHPDPMGMTALHLAITSPDHTPTVALSISRVLVEQGGANVSAKFRLPSDDKPEMKTGTALYEAANRDYQEIVEFLISKGAPINEVNSLGLSPLYAAVLHQNAVMVKTLLEAGAETKIGLESEFKSGQNILHMAARGHNLDILKMLLVHGANDPKLVGAKNKDGHTPAQVAQQNGNLEAAKLLEDVGSEAEVEM